MRPSQNQPEPGAEIVSCSVFIVTPNSFDIRYLDIEIRFKNVIAGGKLHINRVLDGKKLIQTILLP